MKNSQELESIPLRYAMVNNTIKATLAASNRPENAVKLVVVTKGQRVEKIQSVIESGATLLGENYPEETASKIPELTRLEKISWHMIGHIQSRKMKFLVRYFDTIESVESLETAEKLNQKFAEAGRRIRIMLEVNLSGETSKQGFDVDQREKWPAFVDSIAQVARLESLEVCGLMTMPPLGDNAEASRKYFQQCRALGDFVNEHLGQPLITELSMGTSSDYTVAIEEGATLVRVGEAIMGPRFYA